MKKAIGLLMIVAVMMLVFVGGVFAAAEQAVDNSKACDHASDTGKANANEENSVLGQCENGGPIEIT